MITNKREYDNATEAEREQFRKRLAGTIKHWRWRDGEWVLVEDTREIERFGLTTDDFDEIPEPPRPERSPDEKEAHQRIGEIDEALERLDGRYGDRALREDLLERDNFKSDKARQRIKDAEDKAAELRAERDDLVSKYGEPEDEED